MKRIDGPAKGVHSILWSLLDGNQQIPGIRPLIATTIMVLGAYSVIIKRHVHAAARTSSWLARMLSRKPPMLARVTLANQMARIVWALIAKREDYRAPAATA